MLKHNLYIVEDNPLLASALKHFLTRNGYHICGLADSYEKAVPELTILKPDLVITDIMLSTSKTGIDLARYINRRLQIPFIFQSSVNDDAIIASALLTNPVSYLPKPVNRSDLLNAIGSFFRDSCISCLF